MSSSNKVIDMCAGQAPDGTQVCQYRDKCLRFVTQANDQNWYTDFWKAGDNCPAYLSLPKDYQTISLDHKDITEDK